MSITSLSARLIVASCFGLGLAVLVLFWVTDGGRTWVLRRKQYTTSTRIQQAARALDGWKVQHKKYPAPSSFDAYALIGVDGWRHPLRYSLVNGVPLIESLGRDDMRGGVGLDCDLSNRNLRPAGEGMSRLQQLTDPLMQEVVFVALLCAVVAGALVFWSLQDEETRPHSWVGLGIWLSVAFVVAVFGALSITVAHIPSGHW